MSHHIYHSRALVIGSYQSREANRHFRLLTREFGLVTASAQGVRAPLSKLRPGLSLFSLSEVAMIHAKNGWKITNAIETRAFWPGIRSDKAKQMLAAHIAQLVHRLVRGEEKHEQLFSQCLDLYEMLASRHLSLQEIRAAECIVVVRILAELGYIAADETISPFLAPKLTSELAPKFDCLDEKMLALAHTHRKSLLSHINEALKVSQL